MSAGISKRTPILRCALADLFYEWPLNLCIALGIAALLFPLAVLYGLKFGVVSVLEKRLMNDPRSREIRPAASGFFTREWIDRQRSHPSVAFVVGLPKTVASTVRIPVGEESVDASILPTAAGDPLLDAGALPPPGSGQGVISNSLARQADLQPGDLLTFAIARREENAWQEVEARLKVIGILPEFALDYPAILVAPETAEAVENYLDGLAVPEFGWQGEAALARPAYDGALVISSSPPPPDALEYLSALMGGTGFTSVQKWEAPGFGKTKSTVFFLSNANNLVDESNIELLSAKIEGTGFLVVPWLENRLAGVRWQDHRKTVQVLPWSTELEEAGLAPALGLDSRPRPTPWPAVIQSGPTEMPDLFLVWEGVAGELQIPLYLTPSVGVSPSHLWLSARDAGILRRSLERGVEWQNGQMVYTRRGYASFRMAADSIDEVISLRDYLAGEGLGILADTQRIADIQFLEQQLGRIFALFAAVAGVGTVTCLLAMAFSAAERKRRVLAFLQILGAGKMKTARFPLYQCLGLSLGGAGLAWGAQAIFSVAVNRIFQSRLLPGERLSELPPEAVALAVGVLLLISLACYVLVLPRFIGMPLGEAAREP